jgi:hypothetical protein
MMGPSEADAEELLRRRRFLVLHCLLASFGAVLAMLMVVLDGYWAGYSVAVFGGGAVAFFTIRLLAPLEILLALSASHFCWFALEYASEWHGPPEVHPTWKPSHLVPEASRLGVVWDRKLDSTP